MKPKITPAAGPSFRIPGVLALLVATVSAAPFRITVIDESNGWPVPLVELRTTNDVSFVTDNAGVVAFDLPECMGTETWLHVSSHGYEMPEDGFGYRGVRVTPESGGSHTIRIGRKQIAKRLGRLTGSGLFAESQKLGEFADVGESGVTGMDTVQLATHRGKLVWLWGDTNIPGYPLGIFHTSAATTGLNPLRSPEPPVSIDYQFIRGADGRPRGVAEMPGDGPTWLSGFISLPDKTGREHLVATYAKIRGMLTAYQFGLVEWDDRERLFRHVSTFWEKQNGGDGPPKPYPDGHPVRWKDPAGKEWVYFNGPPDFRCPASYEAWKDRSTWEKVENPRSFETADGGKIDVASAAVAWSAYRKRFVMIVQQKFGKTSPFGEVWYLEGETPEGPWGPAVQVATHQNYTFYNVQIDWQLTDPEKPVLLFEGTYVTTFTDNQRKTPRYDYNQMLYRLDLDDRALRPAQPDRP